MLDIIALLFIPVMSIMIAAAIVFIGGLPGKIAQKREHPWPDAVNAASWIGLATGVLWPFAFVWAFLPVPNAEGSPGKSPDAGVDDREELQKQVEALEAELAELRAESSGEAPA